jgi:outer membrane protein assembly factor BamB
VLIRKTKAGVVAIAAAGALAVGGAELPTAAATSSWTNYHFDPGHTANDTGEPPMSSVASLWTSSAFLDPTMTRTDRVYGEPLVLNGTVYVATQRNVIYALDATTGATRWSLSLASAPYNLPSVPRANVTTAAGIGSGCGNIDPMGIIGTSVIDPTLGAAGTLFAAVETWDGTNNSTIRHELVAVDLAGHSATHVDIDPVGVGFDTGATRALEQQRSALALAGGRVVVTYGGLAGDCGAYHGFAVSLPENLTGTAATFEVDKDYTRGGIWAAGGPAVDASGNVYITTGNGAEPSNTYEYSDGVIKLSPTMLVQDYFAPSTWSSENSSDLDLGSQGPLVIGRPIGNPLIFATGKQLNGYLLDSGNLGHIGGQVYGAKVCDTESFGASAFMATDSTAGYLYVPCGEGLRGLAFDTSNASAPTFARSWLGPSDATGPPIVAGGAVWVRGSGRLYQLSPYTGAVLQAIGGVDTAYNFSTPTTTGGSLFYAGNNHVVAFAGKSEQWSGWAPLNGASSGRVAVASNLDGRLEVMLRNADGAIWHAWQQAPNGGWSGWYSMGGNPAGDPQLGRNKDGRLEAFVVGTDGELWHAWQLTPNAGWSAWYPLGGSLAGRPAVINNQDGRLEVIARGSQGAAWHAWQTAPNGGWSAIYGLGGSVTGDPSVASNSDGRIEAFMRGADGGSWHIYQVAPNSGWSAWSSLGGLTSGSPAAAVNLDGRLQVFVRSSDNNLYSASQVSAGGGWSAFGFNGGPIDTDPAVGRNLDGRLDVFASNYFAPPNGFDRLYQGWQSRPGGPIVWGGALALFPSGAVATVGTDADGRLEVFDRAADSAVWHAWELAPNGGCCA